MVAAQGKSGAGVAPAAAAAAAAAIVWRLPLPLPPHSSGRLPCPAGRSAVSAAC